MRDTESLNSAIQDCILSKDFELYEENPVSSERNRSYSVAFRIILPYMDDKPVSDTIIKGIRDTMVKTKLVKNMEENHQSETKSIRTKLEQRVESLENEVEKLTVYKNHYNLEYQLRHGENNG